MDYGVNVKFKGDDKYLSSKGGTSILRAGKGGLNLKLTIPNGTYNAGDNLRLTCKVSDKNNNRIDGMIRFYESEFNLGNVDIVNNSASINFSIPEDGTYTFYCTFDGNSFYNSARSQNVVLTTNVSPILNTNITITASPQIVEKGQNTVITIKLKDEEGNLLKGKPIKILKNNYYLKKVNTDNNGVATITETINVEGNVSYEALYEGHPIENYNASSAVVVITGRVSTISTTLTMINNASIYPSHKLKLLYKSDNGNPIPNKSVFIRINNVTYERITNDRGIAMLSINLDPRTYSFSANVQKHGNYLATSLEGSVTVFAPLTVEKTPNRVEYEGQITGKRTWDMNHASTSGNPYSGPTDEVYIQSGELGSRVGTWPGVQLLFNHDFNFNIPNNSKIFQVEAIWIARLPSTSAPSAKIDVGTGRMHIGAGSRTITALDGLSAPGMKSWTQNNVQVEGNNISANDLNNLWLALEFQDNSTYNIGKIDVGWVSAKIKYVPPQE